MVNNDSSNFFKEKYLFKDFTIYQYDNQSLKDITLQKTIIQDQLNIVLNKFELLKKTIFNQKVFNYLQSDI